MEECGSSAQSGIGSGWAAPACSEDEDCNAHVDRLKGKSSADDDSRTVSEVLWPPFDLVPKKNVVEKLKDSTRWFV